MILHDRTDIFAMCGVCNSVIYGNGEVKDDGCISSSNCMLLTHSAMFSCQVYCFRLNTGQVIAVDYEDKKKIIGYNWRWDGSHVTASIDGRTVLLHRLVMGVTDPKILIDHRWHDTCDNRKSQLRDATVTTNRRNTRKSQGNSNYLGVYLDERRDRYAASIQYKDQNTGKRTNRHLGYFPNTPEGEWAAAEAFNRAAQEAYGEFAVLNARQPFSDRGIEGSVEDSTQGSGGRVDATGH